MDVIVCCVTGRSAVHRWIFCDRDSVKAFHVFTTKKGVVWRFYINALWMSLETAGTIGIASQIITFKRKVPSGRFTVLVYNFWWSIALPYWQIQGPNSMLVLTAHLMGVMSTWTIPSITQACRGAAFGDLSHLHVVCLITGEGLVMSFPHSKLNKNVHTALWMKILDFHILVQEEEEEASWLDSLVLNAFHLTVLYLTSQNIRKAQIMTWMCVQKLRQLTVNDTLSSTN